MRALLPPVMLWAAAMNLAGCDPEPQFDHYILALSWQPAFCVDHERTPECRRLQQSDFAANNLTLHGLWPSDTGGQHPAYCGVPASERAQDEKDEWCAMPVTAADGDTHYALEHWMPGYAVCLDRHEWLKHGTCSGEDADTYFDTSMRLTEAFQQTGLAELLRKKVGNEVARNELIGAFTAEFGKETASALTLTCVDDSDRTLLGEVRLALKPEAIDQPLSASSLFLGRKNPAGGCPARFLIDLVGYR